MSPLKLNHHVTTKVRAVRPETERIRVYELADPDDWALPPWTAGAHIDVHLENGAVRQYSLCGDPARADRYAIAVQREHDGRGGSATLQDTLAVGSVVPVSLPRNHFSLAADARHHVMIAGGIGITPFLPMTSALSRAGASFELHYCARSPEALAFADRLMPLAEAGRVRFYTGAARLDLAALLGSPRDGEHIYCCGPARMTDAVAALTAARAPGSVHFESFGHPAAAAPGAEKSFTVTLARSGRSVPVGTGQTILAALREAGIPIDASCEAGVCSSCKTRYLAGHPIHRDLILKPEERREFMMPCVSGSAGDTLVLDL